MADQSANPTTDEMLEAVIRDEVLRYLDANSAGMTAAQLYAHLGRGFTYDTLLAALHTLIEAKMLRNENGLLRPS